MQNILGQRKVWYIDERAEQLAFIHLSRRDDLIITKLQNDYGLDFLVEIHQNGEPTGRVFGVQVKAQLSLEPVYQNVDTGEVKIDIGRIPPFNDIPFPLCLFVFGMSNDTAYYKWVKQPVITQNGNTQLWPNQTNTFKALTRESLNEIVTQINLWYKQKASQ